MPPDGLISIEVVYAGPASQDVIALDVREGTRLCDAIALSGLPERYPGLDTCRAGIFGVAVPPDTVLREGDRVEIYRPLVADPKQARRQRSARPR